MKSFSPSSIVWGVEEIPGEENVLLVQSKSRAGVKQTSIVFFCSIIRVFRF